MKEISDEVLIEEIKKRLNENRNVLIDLREMNRKLEKLNEKLRESESLKSNFLSNIRNEINNPLTVILGMSKRLARGASAPAAAADMAQSIYKEAFELDFQLKNIFTAAHIEAGEITISNSRTNVEALVRRLVDSFQHKAVEKKLRVAFDDEISADAGELYFKTDPEKLSCIISNLLANAIEYSREEKSVKIRAWKEGTRLSISVEDEGPGIDEKDREKIFDRFTQLDTGARKRHRGHGLGLCIIKALADILEGEITFSSRSGKGSIFTLALDESEGSGNGGLSEEGNEFIFDDAKEL